MKNIINSKVLYQSLGVCFCLAISAFFAYSQITSGGDYTIEQSVIAGGANSPITGGIYTIEGTIGQNAAGTQQQNSPFKFQPGFWTAAPLVITAAEVTVSGRVTASDGRGIDNVLVKMTGANGEMRTVMASSFGYFRFNDVVIGETYIFTVQSRRFTFAQPTLVRAIFDDTDDINFIADN